MNTLARVEGLIVEIPLPAFVAVDQVSLARGICSGTTLLRCDLGSRAAGESDFIDITLRLTGAGAFNSDIVIRALNDTNASNDLGRLQIQATAAATTPPVTPPSNPSASGSGGGGGRLEWLLLGVLGLMSARRARRRFHHQLRRAFPARYVRALCS